MKRVARIAAVAAALVVAIFTLLVLSTLSRESGRVRVAGLSQPVLIELDGHGVPTIRGESMEDVFFGLGYAHARDRLWQMEFQRRLGAGRLAEILGPELLETDRFLRTIGFRRAAESAFPALSPRARALLEAYVRGVNGFVAVSSSRPAEFRILRVEPEPFAPVDCLAWAKLMAWDLAANASNEIRRARFVSAVGPERAAELLPPVPIEPTILMEEEWRGDPRGAPLPSSAAASHPPMDWRFWRRLEERLALLGGDGREVTGSNSWVIAGSRTATGRPLLANDPHLAFRAPSIWYLARLEAPDFSVRGATLPGIPGVIIGQNRTIAWGLTSLEPDVQDLYIEKTDPADPSRYFFRGGWRKFETRTEPIRVRGKPDDTFTIRTSVHGPIVTNVLAGAGELAAAELGVAGLGPPVALRWTGLDPGDTTAEAFFRINNAGGWEEFVAGAALLRSPAQNLTYADVDGHIGYTASGAIPVRSGWDGLLPVSGTGESEWSGYVPFEQLPRALDPPRGYVVTANNRVAKGNAPLITADWPEGYRARRITDLLTARPRIAREDMKAIQLDRVSYQARDLLPLLLDTRPADQASREALDRLRGWNFEFSLDSVPASIYAAWYTALSSMPEDELRGTPPGNVRSRFLINALRGGSAWCDDIRTAKKESCTDFKSDTLRRGLVMLRERLGNDPSRWQWSRLHVARFPHGVLGAVPVLDRWFTERTGQGGDASTVNVGPYRRDGSFLMGEGPSYRQIVDLAALDRGVWVHSPGQSGNVFRSGYRNLIPLWRDGRYLAMDAPAMKTLVLEPGGSR